MARSTSDPVARLQAWVREIPRVWETQRQFERRIRLIGERFPNGSAQRWIDEELACAAILWDASLDAGSIEWSDLRCDALRTADEARRHFERTGAAAFESGHLNRMLHEREQMEVTAESGDGPAFRDFAAQVEWRAHDARDWIALADACEAVGETRAAEAFLAHALGMSVFANGETVVVSGMRAFRQEMRLHLRDVIARNIEDVW